MNHNKFWQAIDDGDVYTAWSYAYGPEVVNKLTHLISEKEYRSYMLIIDNKRTKRKRDIILHIIAWACLEVYGERV